MVKIYLVRHCEAEGNKAGIFQGSTDCDISETGKEQLRFLTDRFDNIHIDKAFSSPLIRAKKTAVAAVNNKHIPIITDEAFTEMNGGVIEGKLYRQIFADYPELKEHWINSPQNFAPPGGEAMRRLYDRAYYAVSRLATDAENDEKALLIATHGAFIRCLLCRIVYNNIEKLGSMPFSDNTAVSLLICDKNGIRAEFINDSSHVPDDFLPKENRVSATLCEK